MYCALRTLKEQETGPSDAARTETTVDVDHHPVLNSAGDAPDQSLTRLASLFRFNVTGNRSYRQNLGDYAAYFYPFCTYNTGAVTIRGRTFGAKKLLMLGASYAEAVENGFRFERWTWQMAVNPLGWEMQWIPDRGYNQLVGGERRKIVDGDPKEPVSQPYPLNAGGTKKTSAFDAPESIGFKPYLPEDFSFFNWTTSA